MSRQRGGTSDRAMDDPRYRFLARFGSVILSGGIAAVPRAIYYYQAELGLLPQEVWFVGYILAHRWTAELPYPSLRKMARRTGVTYQMLHRYKNSLIAKDYLHVIPRTRDNGGRTTNSYDFSGLFQAIEALLLRDRGVMDEALDEPDPDPDDAAGPGQPQLIGPDRPGLTRSGKPRLTAPDLPQRTTGRDPTSTQESLLERKGRSSTTTTLDSPARRNPPQKHPDRGTDRTTRRAATPTELLDLYAAANGRPATPLQAEALTKLAAELDQRLGAGSGAEWIAGAIREASDAGSSYLSPRLIRRICDRWLADRGLSPHPQSENDERTEFTRDPGPGVPLPGEKWRAATDRLAISLSPANFQAFVAPVRPVGLWGDRVCLAVPDDLTAQRLTGSFRSVVEAALTAVIGRRVSVECRVEPRGGEARRA